MFHYSYSFEHSANIVKILLNRKVFIIPNQESQCCRVIFSGLFSPEIFLKDLAKLSVSLTDGGIVLSDQEGFKQGSLIIKKGKLSSHGTSLEEFIVNFQPLENNDITIMVPNFSLITFGHSIVNAVYTH